MQLAVFRAILASWGIAFSSIAFKFLLTALGQRPDSLLPNSRHPRASDAQRIYGLHCPLSQCTDTLELRLFVEMRAGLKLRVAEAA